MKISDFVIDTLAAEGVTHVFEICGGALGHLLDSLYGRSDIVTISMHHEMAASIAAEGYARASENLGVAMATSGPGATNMITGIGSCYFDSIPCLFITGQVNTYEYKFDKPVRQIGFQETDIVTIVKPIVKNAVMITDPGTTPKILSHSICLARTGRPGPVLLDLPLNIQRSCIESSLKYQEVPSNPPPDNIDIERIRSLIEASVRPIILAGGGIRSAKATKELLKFSGITGIPIVVSLMGLDAFPHDNPLYIGMIGTYGNRYANLAIANADLIIALGTRFDTRQTGTRPETFARAATIVHVDIDAHELNNKIKADIPLHCDIRVFLNAIMCTLSDNRGSKFQPWLERIRHYTRKYGTNGVLDNHSLTPVSFLQILSKSLPDNAIVCADVGQNQMWAAQTLVIKGEQRFLTQGGMASIGSALPMAIGASFAKPDCTIVVVIGDGGFQLNIQELQTIRHHNLPIKIILFNNNGYGMIRQFQEQYFEGRLQSSVIGYSNPDFQKVVRAYDIPAAKISMPEEVPRALSSLFSNPNPGFLEIIIDGENKVFPKLAMNRPIEDQEPCLSREELRSAMIIDLIQEHDKP